MSEQHIKITDILKYFSSKLAPPERKSFENHIIKCYKCAEFYSKFENNFDNIMIDILEEAVISMPENSKHKTFIQTLIEQVKDTCDS